MSKIKIKNFGPIGDGLDINDGFIDMKKVTIFIGNQATGKSTIVKIYSVFLWLEKMLYRDTLTQNLVKTNFVHDYCAYQGLELFFNDETYLHYKGQAFSFIYENQQLEIIDSKENNYLSPQVVYTPAERNFLSSISNSANLKNLPKILSAFLSEFEKSKENISTIKLPLDNLTFEYEKETKKSFVSGNNYKIPLSASASGIQSLLPIYLISKFFSEEKKENNTIKQISLEEQNKLKENLKKILSNHELSDEIRETAIKTLSATYQNNHFINIVEELEQNLFPISQKDLLYSLLEFININKDNKLILTTHSPYILTALNNVLLANDIKKEKGNNAIQEIINTKLCIDFDNISAYAIEDGNIKTIVDYEERLIGINIIDSVSDEFNNTFDALLSLQD